MGALEGAGDTTGLTLDSGLVDGLGLADGLTDGLGDQRGVMLAEGVGVYLITGWWITGITGLLPSCLSPCGAQA